MSRCQAFGLCYEKQGCSVRSGHVAAVMWVHRSETFYFFLPLLVANTLQISTSTNNSGVRNRSEEEEEEEEEEDMMESEVDWTQKQRDLSFSVCAGQMLLFLIILTDSLRRSLTTGHEM